MHLRLDCQGVVQGVGFRPAVARLAASLGLSGSAVNVAGAVRLELWGEHQALLSFVERLPRELPDGAQLDPLQPFWSLGEGSAPVGSAPMGSAPQGSAPLGSAPLGLELGCASARPLHGSPVATALVADRAPCAACLAELNDPADRRYRYPFISCCRCGPRYSIATHEPFSRAGTTLAGFPLCAACEGEFLDPANRRFHAETIGCWQCGPRLRLLRADGTPLAPGSPASAPTDPTDPTDPSDASKAANASDPLNAAVALLRQGAILALQGVGGFQLLALAQHTAAVAALRERKRRPHKPLALLVDDPSRLGALLKPSQAELRALRDPAAPIVLLPCPARVHGALLPGVAPGAPALGVMLPASPLHWLLARELAEPLVATSGNRGGEPLCLDPEEALRRLAGLADAFLVHNRPIARRLDDSVLQVIDGRPALLRRSRGYAPQPLDLPPPKAGQVAEAGAGAWEAAEDAVEDAVGVGPAADQGAGDGRVADQGLVVDGAVPNHQARPDAKATLRDKATLRGKATLRANTTLSANTTLRANTMLRADTTLRTKATLPANAPLRDQATPPDETTLRDQATRPDPIGPRGDGRPRNDQLTKEPGGSQGHPASGALLALGGDLKASPALALGDRVWPAPHLGDLQDRRCQGLLEEGLDALAARWGEGVGALLGDRHPDGLGRQLAARWPRPIRWIGVQHHLAHALSVVAERRLELPLLAVCADGLGYGAPELGHQPMLWGCELLWITASGAERLASLRPLPLPGGDRAQREPRRLALGLLAQLGAEGLDHPGARATLEAFEPAERTLLLRALATNLNCPLSSSLGRLFDAVASLLDLCQVLSHEGQGGLLLQGVASDGGPAGQPAFNEATFNEPLSDEPPIDEPAVNEPAVNEPAAAQADLDQPTLARPLVGLNPYPLPLLPAPGLPLGWLDWRPLLRELLADRANGQTQASCAARFHQGVSQGLAELLRQAAAPRGCRQVVLAGGCFQNALLLSLLLDQLRAVGLQPHWGEQLPCNDGGLALGQIWAARLGVSITPAERPRADA